VITDVPPLFAASVPVFRHYLARVSDLAERAGPAALDSRIGDGPTAAQHFALAAGFAMQVACPLAGRAVPDLPAALGPRLAVARAILLAIRPADFAGAEARVIRHRAGAAELEQGAADFLHLFAMPSFLFHVAMGHATLRAGGMAIGPADFDGFHT
jgi:hypothetical protein